MSTKLPDLRRALLEDPLRKAHTALSKALADIESPKVPALVMNAELMLEKFHRQKEALK